MNPIIFAITFMGNQRFNGGGMSYIELITFVYSIIINDVTMITTNYLLEFTLVLVNNGVTR